MILRPMPARLRGVPALAALLLAAVLTWSDAAPAAAIDSAVAGAGVDAISAGAGHTCALKGGGVWCWGKNPDSALGNTTTLGISRVPVAVRGMGSGVTAISAGRAYTCALKDGGAWCWGQNDLGQLGDGTTTDSSVPVAVSGLGSEVSAISTRNSHTCALKDGGAWCWGRNDLGQLGNGTATDSHVPVAVSGLGSGVSAISAGETETCALKDGGVWCWGNNFAGALGDGSTGPGLCGIGTACGTTPVAVVGQPASSVTAISNTCALKDRGVHCWGPNASGQLGNGTTTKSRVPVAVSGLGSGVSAISAGSFHRCALTDGGVWCWGRNGSGQLGDGTRTDSSVRVAVVGLTASKVTAISPGEQHSCALMDGGVWCWGLNFTGQLGNGTRTDSSVPIAVSGLGRSPSASRGRHIPYRLALVVVVLAVVAAGAGAVWRRRRAV